MATQESATSYEEVRRQRLLDNKKRFESNLQQKIAKTYLAERDLGLLKLSKGLSDLKKPEKKSQQWLVKRKQTSSYSIEPRRSSRARNPVPSYREDVSPYVSSYSIEPRRSSRVRNPVPSYREDHQNDDDDDDDEPVEEVASEADDTQKEVAKGKKKPEKAESKKPSKSKKETASEVSAVRRSSRNK